MLEKIAMWGGIAGIVVALVAIIVLFLTRANILDILDKDVILFDKNFELKKQAIETSMLMMDELEEKGEQLKSSFEFEERAKKTYNELLCVVSDARVADEFYNLALDKTEALSATNLAHYKLLCRRDIGLSNKKSKLLKRAKTTSSGASNLTNFESQFEQQSRATNFDRPAATRPMPQRSVPPMSQTQQPGAAPQTMANRPAMQRPVGKPTAPRDREE